ncbi:hypothetical protein C8J57DRAFT_1512109 [Mycena rebaudengoi]|nr:hypothetical protein C8J57DRAFT_1512109 [Mycena rebaudengoi]
MLLEFLPPSSSYQPLRQDDQPLLEHPADAEVERPERFGRILLIIAITNVLMAFALLTTTTNLGLDASQLLLFYTASAIPGHLLPTHYLVDFDTPRTDYLCLIFSTGTDAHNLINAWAVNRVKSYKLVLGLCAIPSTGTAVVSTVKRRANPSRRRG